MKVSVVPDIKFRGRVVNYGATGNQVGEGFKEIQFMTEPITITMPDGLPVFEVKRRIKRRLKDLISTNLDKIRYKDVGSLIGEEGSPPQIIKYPSTYDLFEEDKDAFIKSVIQANFTILTTNDPFFNNLTFGKERVFNKVGNVYSTIGKGSYYEGEDETLSCAYDYLIHNYSKKRCVSKFTTSYNTTGKRGNKTTGKELIDYWISLPYPEHKTIYDEWERRNKDSIFMWDITRNKSYPMLDGEIELEDLQDDLWNIKFMNIDIETSPKEEERGMTILDLVKWCICADVQLVVRDYHGGHYLTYNPKDFKHEYKQISGKPAIVLKVEHKHAYFETDKTKLISATAQVRSIKKQLNYEELRHKKQNKHKDNEDLPVEYLFDDTLKTKNEAPPPDNPNIVWSKYLDEWRDDLLSGRIISDEPIHNYSIDEIYELANKKLKRIVLCVDRSNLNELAVEMLDKHKLKHDISTGTIHALKRLTYGNLTILSRCGKNKGQDFEALQDWSEVFKQYPELKQKSGVSPTEKKVGDYFFRKVCDEPILSTMNGQLRKLFYECEVKPANLDLNSLFYDHDIVSFDIKKAYTTALLNNEFRWNVYDTISQPRKFSGTLNPNWFYLAKPLSAEYPVKQGGMMLYHGSLLRHLQGKVEIKYELEPKRSLSPEIFKDFVERVKYETGKKGCLRRLMTYKSIINCFIGGLKRKDSTSNYHHYITNDKHTINRVLSKGVYPSKIGESDYWLIPNAWKNAHYQNGQPIRLQVLDMINEQIYLFHRWCGKVFKYPTLSIRTDAVYTQTKYKKIDCESNEEDEINDRLEIWNKENVYQFELEKTMTPKTYRMMRFSADHKAEEKPFRFMPNKWERDIIINKKWSLNYGAKHLTNIMIESGGCLVEGKAGRGKSELILYLKKRCRKNFVRYCLYKYCLKQIGAKGIYDKCEKWRRKRPCIIQTLAPTNKASNRIQGKTLHKAWGIPVISEDDVEEDEDQLTECYTDKIIETYGGNGFSRDAVDVAVIDEISMCSGEIVSYISYFKQKLPHIKIILCGDIPHQLPPPKEEHRNFAGGYVMKEITNFTRIELQYNFRMNTSGDVLWDDWSINPHKFYPTTQQTTKRNLCAYNITRKQVIEKLQDLHPCKIVIESKKHDNLRGHTKYTKIDIGTPMIAMKTQLEKGIAKNEMFYVVAIDDEDNITLINTDADEELRVEVEYNKDELLKYFQSGWAITIHKAQGETYKDKYTIWDWRSIAMKRCNFGRKLRYVAQSRSNDPENNILYQL